jgi:CubicO group peptidase (beta-lactamase class C family)
MVLSRRDLLLGAGGAWASRATGAWPAWSGDDLQETVEALRARLGLPALGVCIASVRGTPRYAASGYLRVDRLAKVRPDVYWQLGSITKTFTATLATKLIEERRATWDTTLGEIFPEWRSEMASEVAGVTLRHLMTHTSGMGFDVVPWQGNPETNAPGLTMPERRLRFVRLALQAPLQFAPGERRHYSNQGYNVLGAVLERLGKASFEDQIKAKLCDPLGIRPRFGEPALRAPGTEPWPHLGDGGRYQPVEPIPLDWYGYHLCAPAGGLALSLGDFGLWMREHLRGESRGGILSPAGFRGLHGRSESGVLGFVKESDWPATGPCIGHIGSNTRNHAFTSLFLDRGIGIFAACNAPSGDGHVPGLLRDAVLALAFPRIWPMPAMAPERADGNGVVPGERLFVAEATGGKVSFQNFADRLIDGFQLWWSDAPDAARLVLRARVRHPGRYSLTGRFGSNSDFGAVTLKVGDLSKRLDFHAGELGWNEIELGDARLASEVVELEFTAHGTAGKDGIVCHLALDALRLRPVGG